MNEMTMTPSEMRSVRQAMRELPKLVQSLADGEVAKYVLTNRGRPVAVLLYVEDYAEMVEKTKPKDNHGRDRPNS